MTAAQATRLANLYPAGWRAKYGADFVDILTREPLSATLVANVGAGALDAWISPERWLHDPVEANAYTLRFWRVPMPSHGRSLAPQLLLMFGLVVALKAGGDAGSWASGDPAIARVGDATAVPLAAAIGTVSVWFRGFSLRTKAVAAVVTSAFAFGALSAVDWVMRP